ncbi:MAG: hypothetical protein STSR0001_09480 [Methanothrix sp.]
MNYLLLYRALSTRIIVEKFTKLGIINQRRAISSNTPVPPKMASLVSVADAMTGCYFMQTADYPNTMFANAIDPYTIRRDIISMGQKDPCKVIELSEMAKSAIATAISELETGACKTFSSIDELFDDLESD